MSEENTVVLQTAVEMEVTTPVSITLPLPAGFADGSSTLYVRHEKGSKVYYHLGTVETDASGSATLTFTNSKGFSTFTVLGDGQALIEAAIGELYYDDLGSALNDAAAGQTVTVLQDGLSGTMSGSSRTITVKNGTGNEITVSINGKTLKLGAMEAAEYTYTRSSGGGTSAYYDIQVETAENGSVQTSPATRAAVGSTVTVTVTPDQGYAMETLTVKDADGKAVSLAGSGGTYTFRMPASDVTVSAVFRAGSSALPFTDVDGHWALDAIAYVYERGMMNGVSATKFAPGTPLSRGMIVTILHRMEGSPAVSGSDFSDVSAGQYYAAPIAWASANGIVNGYPDGAFRPEEPVTREQLAAILYRYAQYKGMAAVTLEENLAGFADADSVSGYAVQAMNWAVGQELINGMTATTLVPQGTATRAQVAAILMRYCESVAN